MRLSFYHADTNYCEFLRKSDPLVPYTFDQKSTRPFVGIVFDMGDIKYYAPLSSPKSKHLEMKNQIDFSNKDIIFKQAAKLYHVITQGKGRSELRNRCCNFIVDEQQYFVYQTQKNEGGEVYGSPKD